MKNHLMIISFFILRKQITMEYILSIMPAWLACLLFVFLTVLLSVGGLSIARRLLDLKRLKESHEVSGFLLGIVGVFYAIILTFVVVAVWEDYEEVNAALSGETNELNDLYFEAAALPDSAKNEIQNSIVSYATAMKNAKWDLESKEGKLGISSHSGYTSLQHAILQFNPANEKEKIILGTMLNDLNQLSNFRSDRVSGTESHVPDFIWVVLFIGGCITLIFTYFFYVENKRFQVIMTSLLACLFSLVFFLGLLLDHPFSGSTAISKDAVEQLLNNIGQ